MKPCTADNGPGNGNNLFNKIYPRSYNFIHEKNQSFPKVFEAHFLIPAYKVYLTRMSGNRGPFVKWFTAHLNF